MICAVMSNTLNSIMLSLKNAIDSQHKVTNLAAFKEAIFSLERFPMTMTQLQDTRVGALLNKIRHNVDADLQKRIRFVIKTWQQLLNPQFNAVKVIPIKDDKCSDNFSHSLSLSNTNSDLPLSQELHLKNNSISRKRIHSNGSTPINSPIAPYQNNPNAVINRPQSPYTNGQLLNTLKPFKPDLSQPKVLTKVKSTADLLKSAGDCIDSATAEKILTHSLHKNTDEDQQKGYITSPGYAKSSRRTSCYSTAQSAKIPTPTSRKPDSNVKKSSQNIKDRPFDSVSSSRNLQAGKSEMMAKFLASSSSEQVSKPTHLQLGLEAMKNACGDESADELKSHSTKKHKRKKTRKSSENGPYSQFPPVTNFLDKWPCLPKLPERIDWESLDKDFHGLETITKNPEEIFSVAIGDGMFHVLPWIDMNDERKVFFPDQTDSDLQQIIDNLPQPW